MFTICGFKITNFSTFYKIYAFELPFLTKNSYFDPKMVKYICEIDSIFTAAKNYTSNFSVTPFGPDYCTSSKASPTALFNHLYFQCIFKIFHTFGQFFIIFIPFKKKTFCNFNLINNKTSLTRDQEKYKK